MTAYSVLGIQSYMLSCAKTQWEMGQCASRQRDRSNAV